MIKQRKWWQWPQGYIGDFLPWYTVAWRLATLLPILAAGVLLWTLVCVGYGPREANWILERLWK